MKTHSRTKLRASGTTQGERDRLISGQGGSDPSDSPLHSLLNKELKSIMAPLIPTGPMKYNSNQGVVLRSQHSHISSQGFQNLHSLYAGSISHSNSK
jgi:hypothetical protein